MYAFAGRASWIVSYVSFFVGLLALYKLVTLAERGCLCLYQTYVRFL